MSTEAARELANNAIELATPANATAVRTLAAAIHRLCDELERASSDALARRSVSVPPPGWEPDPVKRFKQHAALQEVTDLDEAIEGREIYGE